MKKLKMFSVRRWLELLGTLLLLYGIYNQREMLSRSFAAIRHAHILPLLACLLLTWLLFVWSASGYRLLLTKPIRFWHILLAHLSAGGPGRVLPGGAGQLSFGTLFLHKQGLKLSQAIAVALSNNIMGFIVNMTVLVAIFSFDPDIFHAINLSIRNVSFFMFLIAALFLVTYVLGRTSKIAKKTAGTSNELKKLWLRLGKQPHILLLLVLAMLATIFTNSLMLYFAAQAVDMNITLGVAMVAMSTGVALGSLVPTPGGIGGVEAGLIATMYALGYELEMATSAALIYRFSTYVLPFIPGVMAYLSLRKRELL